eukprot:TRINITY_DN7964_c0_g1_i5.p1 TRINITY_DN7964_c0_g1~~TRINITY_DN7964_c0_g1_i5.p1  ORF type:complete len:239 (-),score=-13.37 TRINITY_DN7964_c0_g1_i5:540-1256(-)
MLFLFEIVFPNMRIKLKQASKLIPPVPRLNLQGMLLYHEPELLNLYFQLILHKTLININNKFKILTRISLQFSSSKPHSHIILQQIFFSHKLFFNQTTIYQQQNQNKQQSNANNLLFPHKLFYQQIENQKKAYIFLYFWLEHVFIQLSVPSKSKIWNILVCNKFFLPKIYDIKVLLKFFQVVCFLQYYQTYYYLLLFFVLQHFQLFFVLFHSFSFTYIRIKQFNFCYQYIYVIITKIK